MFLIYDILYLIVFIFYLPVLLLRGKLHAGFKQRLGFLDVDVQHRLFQKPNMWFHAVSVGEVLAIVGLVEKIRLAHPEKQIVISTVTLTGYALAQKRFRKEDIIIFAPLDLGWIVRRFIKAIRPEIFVIAETEIWPNLLAALAKVDIPIAMVNGRISDKSFYRYQRFQFLFHDVLRSFRACCMQSALDADRMIALGAWANKVTVLGSMKFDDVVSGEKMTPARIGFKEDNLIWIAGSTHPGEEKIILDVFKKLKTKFPKLTLVLAPRHVERAKEVCDLVRDSGLSAMPFSSINPSAVDVESVVVVDTIGHLKSLYSLAAVVFVGKSLVGTGGQNIIEPAYFGKPIIVGPNMQNFADITEIFLEARGILQIQEAGELEGAVSKLLSSSELRHALGERALLTVKKNQGATRGTEKILSEILVTTQFVRPG